MDDDPQNSMIYDLAIHMLEKLVSNKLSVQMIFFKSIGFINVIIIHSKVVVMIRTIH